MSCVDEQGAADNAQLALLADAAVPPALQVCFHGSAIVTGQAKPQGHHLPTNLTLSRKLTIVRTMLTTSNADKKPSKTVSATDFKARCLKLIEEIAVSDEPLFVTKNGKVLVKVMSGRDSSQRKPVFGMHRKLLIPLEPLDLTKPVTDASDWTGDWENVKKRARKRQR